MSSTDKEKGMLSAWAASHRETIHPEKGGSMFLRREKETPSLMEYGPETFPEMDKVILECLAEGRKNVHRICAVAAMKEWQCHEEQSGKDMKKVSELIYEF